MIATVTIPANDNINGTKKPTLVVEAAKLPSAEELLADTALACVEIVGNTATKRMIRNTSNIINVVSIV